MEKAPEAARETTEARSGRRAYRDGVAAILGRPPESIELLPERDTTDLLERHAIRRRAMVGRPEGPRSFAMTARDPGVIQGLLEWMAGRAARRPLLLFCAGSANHGAVRTTAEELLPCALRFLVRGGAGIMATDRDGAFGFVLEIVADWQAESGEPFYKLVAWGVAS